jgi:hypothetical protein
MYPTEVDFKGRPIDKAWAEARIRNESLTEIKQIKGASETHPLLSPNDEFASFEILTYLLGNPEGRFPKVPGSYVRDALKNGIAMQDVKGYNPYKMGVVGGSDSHNTGVPYRQANFYGGHGRADGSEQERMSGHLFAGLDTRYENPAGLTGIWAEENTRASLFEGMQRRETFATSGPRIKVRFFGSWNYDQEARAGRVAQFGQILPDWMQNNLWHRTAYLRGVTMGGDLPPIPEGKKAPSFAVWAVKDPTSGNLDRIQVVKGWTKNGQSFEKVYDAVWAGNRTPDPVTGKLPPIGSTVDIKESSYRNSIGAVELKGVWTDPEFDPSLNAFYYARVLEIPTPRWTTIQAKNLGIDPPDVVPATIQERAWTSPVWYTPTGKAHQAAKPGDTIASLKQKGATALNEDALKKLLIGKSTWVRNNATGDVFKIVWSENGQRLVANVNGEVPLPAQVGDVFHGGVLGTSSFYAIKDGKIETSLGNAPYEVTVYKLGDKYFGARSNEFGYANYELIAEPVVLEKLGKTEQPPR